MHSYALTTRPPLRADLAVPPLPPSLSAGVRPEQTEPLRREQWRPKAVLLCRRRGGGGLPVVSRRWCFWEGCHTNPQSSYTRPGRARRSSKNDTPTTKQLEALSWMSSFWLASRREASRTPDVWAVFMRSLLSI